MPIIDIGFSPCPNDTFIFDALVNHKIDTKGYDFNLHLEDVQTLNEWALQGKLPFSKISYGVWPLVKNNYHLLNAGGALGKGVGPLLVYKENTKASENNNLVNDNKPNLETMTVAVPGINTTAHLLFSLAFPKVKNKKFLLSALFISIFAIMMFNTYVGSMAFILILITLCKEENLKVLNS